MSRSRAYRPTYLPEEVRTQLAMQCRADRAHHALQRVQNHMRGEIGLLEPSDERLDVLHRRIDAATDVADLRELLHGLRAGGRNGRLATPSERRRGAELARTTVDDDRIGPEGRLARATSRLGRETSRLTASTRLALDPRLRPAMRPSGPEIVGLDLVRLRAELGVIMSTADGLGLDLADLAEAERSLDVAVKSLKSGLAETAAGMLPEIEATLNEVDDRLGEALIAAECRARSLDVAVEALAELGYRVEAPTLHGDSTVVFGRAADGSTAEVTVASGEDDGVVGVTSEFTDPGTAVAPDHAAAGELCEPAVAHQLHFSQRLTKGPLRTGPATTDERPTRASLPGASGRKRARRRASAPTKRSAR